LIVSCAEVIKFVAVIDGSLRLRRLSEDAGHYRGK
jgi:hypothetical protein